MQPHLSVIVYGPDIQGHLDECLAGIVAQPACDAEVIVAAVGAFAQRVAETYAAHDPRIVPVPLAEGTTDAGARSAGTNRATGHWLHFVHSKDALAADALRTVIEVTAALPESVDVLLLNHVRSTWCSSQLPTRDGKLLARASREPVSLADAPHLLRVAALLGNRVLRARLWRRVNTEIGAGAGGPCAYMPYSCARPAQRIGAGEPFMAYAVLVCSTAIASLDRVVLENRQLRPASLPPLTAVEWYTLVTQYEAVQRFMADRGMPGPVHATMYDVMVRSWLRIIARSGMPEQVAREFFHRASKAANAWRPEGYRSPAGLHGAHRTLLEQDAYTTYTTLRRANRKRREVRKVLAAPQRKVATRVGKFHYRRDLRGPLDPHLAVFSAYWNRGVFCNPAAIAAELRRIAPHIRPVWAVSAAKVPLLPPGTEHVVAGTRHYWEVLARAKYMVSNVNFPDAVVKRSGSVHVMTHHGTPLKRMGLDQMAYPTASKGLDFHRLLARIDKWDYSVSANSHSTHVWERAYPTHCVSLDYGYPRNDILYRATAADVCAIREKLGIPPDMTAILYAPTHRDYESAWTPRLDLASLSRQLGEHTVLLVRGHYFYDSPATGAAPLPADVRRGRRVIDVSSYHAVEELALAADALVTDYSSVMFDYANLDRPIVIYGDDWETYEKTRGVYFDLTKESPGWMADTQEELAEIFNSGAWRDDTSASARAAFRRRFCEFDDGHAAERVVRRVFLNEGEEYLPSLAPLDKRSPAPSPEESARR